MQSLTNATTDLAIRTLVVVALIMQVTVWTSAATSALTGLLRILAEIVVRPGIGAYQIVPLLAALALLAGRTPSAAPAAVRSR